MEQGNNEARGKKRATFAEFIKSIRFNRGRSTSAAEQTPMPGFAVNQSQHVGIAALDDYKQLVRSSN